MAKNPLSEIATPPPTAKSTSARTRATNRFSNRKKLLSGEGASGEFPDEGVEFIELAKCVMAGRTPPHHLDHRLLHRLNFSTHDRNLTAGVTVANTFATRCGWPYRAAIEVFISCLLAASPLRHTLDTPFEFPRLPARLDGSKAGNDRKKVCRRGTFAALLQS